MGKTTKKAVWILNGLILAVSILLLAGVKLIFPACGLHEDGSYGSCHWAEQAVMAAAMIMTAQALVLMIFRTGASRRGVYVGLACSGIVTALIPNVFIPLCMMPSMRCIASMRPCVMAGGILVCVLSLCGLAASRDTFYKEYDK